MAHIDKKFTFIAAILLPIFFVESAYAIDLRMIEDQKRSQRGQAEYFNTNKDQRFELRVNMVAGVQMPGIYHLPDNTNLLEAISLAGGTATNADLSNVYVKRPNQGGTFDTYHYDLSKLVSNKDFKPPVIGDHDTILIETSNPSQTLIITLSIITTALGIITTGYLISRKN